MLSSCAASTELAISISLRAAFSGSEEGRSASESHQPAPILAGWKSGRISAPPCHRPCRRTDPQCPSEASSKQEIVRRERDLAVHDDIVARTERDGAVVRSEVECRDVKLTKVVDAKIPDIDMVAAQN